jgi:hypothetical protein
LHEIKAATFRVAGFAVMARLNASAVLRALTRNDALR